MVKFAESSPETKDRNGVPTDISRVASEDEDTSKKRPSANGGEEGSKKKRRHKDRKSKDGQPIKKRRYSISKAARDPRDEASPIELESGTRSPSPVIDFDGLSRPSEIPRLSTYLQIQVLIGLQVQELVNVLKRPQNKPKHVSINCLVRCERSSSAWVRTPLGRDFLEHQKDMPKQCYSSRKDIRRMCGT